MWSRGFDTRGSSKGHRIVSTLMLHYNTLHQLENLWAWMDSKLHKLHRCKNVEELKEKLEQVRQSIPSSYLHNVFDGMLYLYVAIPAGPQKTPYW